MGKQCATIGESVEIFYTIYKKDGTLRDLTATEVLRVDAFLHQMKGERRILVQKFTTETEADTLNLSVNSDGLSKVVLHPALSESLAAGDYEVLYELKLDKSDDVTNYPDGYAIVKFNKATLEFKMEK